MNRTNPTISIIVPTYQHAGEIGKSLDSVFPQTFQDFEIIVVNDGSTDDTLAVLRSYEDRITLITQENRGGNAARNRGFREAKGKYLLFCDADVIMRPDMLARMLATLEERPEASYAYSSFRFGWKMFKLWPFDADKLRRMNYVHTTSLIRREHFPGFDEKIKRLQDWDLWLTMLERGHVGVWIPECLFQCLPHKGGISLWVPKVFNAIPWRKFGIRMKNLEKLEEARRVMKEKHHLP
jgi:glycosyltransferase involved in cell wall biosynthesis